MVCPCGAQQATNPSALRGAHQLASYVFHRGGVALDHQSVRGALSPRAPGGLTFVVDLASSDLGPWTGVVGSREFG